MRLILAFVTFWSWMAGAALAQPTMYRCGNEYTNNAEEAKAKKCIQVSAKPKDAPVIVPIRSDTNDDYWSSVIAKQEVAPKKVKELGPIDKWRYDSCRQDAAKSPTEAGVRIGLQICRDKFEQ